MWGKMADKTLQEIANECCRDLPEMYNLVLKLENGAGYVEVEYNDGYNLEVWGVDGADMTIEEQLYEGLKTAIKHNNELG